MKSEDEIEYERIVKSLRSEEAKEKVVRLTYEEFRQQLLPIALMVHKGEEISLAPWNNVTGGVFNGVEVYDPKGKRKTFRTPGLYDRANFTLGTQLMHMIGDAGHKKNQKLDPTDVYAEHLNEKNVKLSFANKSGRHLMIWYAIFALFNYKMVSDKEQTNPILKAISVKKSEVEARRKLTESKPIKEDSVDEAVNMDSWSGVGNFV